MGDLSPKQEGFVRDYLETGNATEAAARNYDVVDRATASNIGYENVRKPQIMAKLQSWADKASDNIYTLANKATNETVKLNANRDILDRTGYKPIEKVDQRSETYNMNMNAEIELDDDVS